MSVALVSRMVPSTRVAIGHNRGARVGGRPGRTTLVAGRSNRAPTLTRRWLAIRTRLSMVKFSRPASILWTYFGDTFNASARRSWVSPRSALISATRRPTSFATAPFVCRAMRRTVDSGAPSKHPPMGALYCLTPASARPMLHVMLVHYPAPYRGRSEGLGGNLDGESHRGPGSGWTMKLTAIALLALASVACGGHAAGFDTLGGQPADDAGNPPIAGHAPAMPDGGNLTRPADDAGTNADSGSPIEPDAATPPADDAGNPPLLADDDASLYCLNPGLCDLNYPDFLCEPTSISNGPGAHPYGYPPSGPCNTGGVYWACTPLDPTVGDMYPDPTSGAPKPLNLPAACWANPIWWSDASTPASYRAGLIDAGYSTAGVGGGFVYCCQQ